jgi:hypothetical protein
MKQYEILHKVSFINTRWLHKRNIEFWGNSLNHNDFVLKRQIVDVIWNNNTLHFNVMAKIPKSD